MTKRYTVYAPTGCLIPQLRDDRANGLGIIAVAPTIGGQWATSQGRDQAVRFLRKVARLLNNQGKPFVSY